MARGGLANRAAPDLRRSVRNRTRRGLGRKDRQRPAFQRLRTAGLVRAASPRCKRRGGHRGSGASAEAAIEALWPDSPPKRGRERFWNALGNLRSRLRGPGEGGVEILTKRGQIYHPDPSVLDIDLWRFEAALDQAAQAGSTEDLIVVLGWASAAYGGDFYPTADALWVEPVREDLHRRALDTQIRLAELYVEGNRADAAIAALERAIELDPICEDAYRRLITLLGDVGREDAAKRTWVLLQGRLAELDLEPEVSTCALAHEVLGRRRSHDRSRLSPTRPIDRVG
jgi:DNA-binding SARP family transcriptional activator